MVYNRTSTREWLGKEDSVHPMAGMDSIVLIMAMIDAHERRDVMLSDVPNTL